MYLTSDSRCTINNQQLLLFFLKFIMLSDWTNNGRNASMYKCTGQFSKIVFQSFFADDTILVMGWNICTLNTVKSRTIWFPSGKWYFDETMLLNINCLFSSIWHRSVSSFLDLGGQVLHNAVRLLFCQNLGGQLPTLSTRHLRACDIL